MAQIYVCGQCESFDCRFYDLHELLGFDSYDLPCPTKIREIGHFVRQNRRIPHSEVEDLLRARLQKRPLQEDCLTKELTK